MLTQSKLVILVSASVWLVSSAASAQSFGQADTGSPGDEMIQAFLCRETEKLSARYAQDVNSLGDWATKRPQYLEEYYYMLGLSPRPEKTRLQATITGTYQGDGYVVDNIHYQSRPQLYVTGNLYRPAPGNKYVREGEKLPALFYVCGHSGRGRNGNKVAYQSHGIWFARHGYVCLVVDSLELGEINDFPRYIHHGTYNLNRWWWYSRGYTPAGVEAWNGVRGIDYLVGRTDVDPARIAVTGISGGGAATFWVAAADERVKVAVPVSGMADLESYVPNRTINGHCDCMFLYNTFQWPWTRIAGLVAPRPMLFINSDNDSIFPMDANERIITRLERLYSLYGASDRVDAVVSIGGHAYRRDIRQAAYRFINAHLKGDARPVDDSEVDVVSEGVEVPYIAIPYEKLRVFPTDADLPKDALNRTIDESFVPMSKVAPPEAGKFDAWKAPLVKELRRVSFATIPEKVAAAELMGESGGGHRAKSPDGVEFRIWSAVGNGSSKIKTHWLVVLNEDEAGTTPAWVKSIAAADDSVTLVEPRGIGEMKWTMSNPPNFVVRSHALLGSTVDTGRVLDVLSTAALLSGGEKNGSGKPSTPIKVAGKGAAGLIAAYAAVLDDRIAGVAVIEPPATHMDNAAPQFLNVLRVCDVPDLLGMIAPRPLTVAGATDDGLSRTTAVYSSAAAKERLTVRKE